MDERDWKKSLKKKQGRKGKKLQIKNTEEDNVDLTATENNRALKGAHRRFVIPGILKADIDSYVDQAKPQIKTLIEDQVKEMQSTKAIITLSVRWKKSVKSAITLDPEDVQGA